MRGHLDTLQSCAGVRATMVVETNGHLIEHTGGATLRRPAIGAICDAIAPLLLAAELDNEHWKSIAATFPGGHLFTYRIDEGHALAIVTGPTYDEGYFHVCARVTSKKLKRVLANGNQQRVAPAPRSSQRQPAPQRPRPKKRTHVETAKPPLYWPPRGDSSITVADTQLSAFLDKCTQAMAFSVGPVAKVLVEKTVRKLAGGGPLRLTQRKELVVMLAEHIPYEEERVVFRRKIALD